MRLAEQLVRDLGHQVALHASAIGVGHALSHQAASAVLLAWEFPSEQDQKLRGLIEAWTRGRALKVFVLVPYPRPELERRLADRSDVVVITYDSIDTQLPAALGPLSLDPSLPVEMGRDDGHFVQRLRSRLHSASIAWEGVAQGLLNAREMHFPLTAARGQAELMKFEKLTELLDELGEVLKQAEVISGRPTPSQYEAVTAALRFAIHAASAPPYDSGRDITPLVTRLRRSRLGA